MESASFAQLSLHLQPTLKAPHDPVDHGQPHPTPLTDWFGGEKRVKYAGNDGLVHAATVIPHREFHIPTGLHAKTLEVPPTFNDQIAEVHLQDPAGPVHGMRSVSAEVHEQLVYLNGISKDDSCIRHDVAANFNSRRQGRPEESEHLLDDDADLQRTRLLRFLAAEGEYLPYQIPGPLGGFGDLRKVLSHIVCFGNPQEPHLRIAEDRGEDVVEVMGYAPGQSADRFHLLGLTQLFFQLDLVRIVDNETLDFGQVSVLLKTPDGILNGADDLAIESSIVCHVALERLALPEEAQKCLSILWSKAKRE